MKNRLVLIIYLISALFVVSCKNNHETMFSESIVITDVEETTSTELESEEIEIADDDYISEEKIYINFNIPYATYSIINDGYAVLYKTNKKDSNYKNKTVAVNAGHGAIGAKGIKTFSHPDFSPRVAGGTNEKGSILSSAISEGMTFINGMTEANANLAVAFALKQKLLDAGYNVLMLRVDDASRLDNIARTVLANEYADCHIAIHFDSTNQDKGIFYITPYNDSTYLNMEPLKSNAHRIYKLGDSIIEAFKGMGEKIWKNKGTLQGDLTQLSFSTNASVDIELGDRKTEVTAEKLEIYATGITKGIDNYFFE